MSSRRLKSLNFLRQVIFAKYVHILSAELYIMHCKVLMLLSCIVMDNLHPKLSVIDSYLLNLSERLILHGDIGMK